MTSLATITGASFITMTNHIGTADPGLFEDIDHANLSETAMGKAALGDNPDRAFTHLWQLAHAKEVTLPTESDVIQHKADLRKLRLTSGNSFDKSDVKAAGVGNDQASDKLLKRIQASAKGVDVEALAGKYAASGSISSKACPRPCWYA